MKKLKNTIINPKNNKYIKLLMNNQIIIFLKEETNFLKKAITRD